MVRREATTEEMVRMLHELYSQAEIAYRQSLLAAEAEHEHVDEEAKEAA